MPFKFCKFHGFGNDYIVLERGVVGSADLSEIASAICDRHTGVGSDGLAVLARAANDPADYFCEIVNPDGSVAGFSGNGTRCAAAYLYFTGLWNEAGLRLETRSGVKTFELLERPSETAFMFSAEIGRPIFAASEIPISDTGLDPLDLLTRLGDRDVHLSAVNVGNPVACTFVDAFPDDWRETGRRLEHHELFPERTNIVFVKVIDRETLDIRIWERGAGETPASGTCSSGAAVLSAALGSTGRLVKVHSPGGITQVEWRDDDEIVLTGRAELAFWGEWPY